MYHIPYLRPRRIWKSLMPKKKKLDALEKGEDEVVEVKLNNYNFCKYDWLSPDHPDLFTKIERSPLNAVSTDIFY